ncbi:MAG: hypothetical protein ACE5FG_05090 [Myxococcota bacterium]
MSSPAPRGWSAGELERELWLYRDGALSERRRRRLEERLARDPQLAARLRRIEALGHVLRESWQEGPPAPAPELLIQTLRPRLAHIERERATRSPLARWRDRLIPQLRAAPALGLAGSLVAALLLLVLSGRSPDPAGNPSEALASFRSPSAIYDLESNETPLMLYEVSDGVTVIWLLDEPREGLSAGPRPSGTA